MNTKKTEYNTTISGMWTKNDWLFTSATLTDEMIANLMPGGKIVFKIAKSVPTDKSPNGYLEFMDAATIAEFAAQFRDGAKPGMTATPPRQAAPKTQSRDSL